MSKEFLCDRWSMKRGHHVSIKDINGRSSVRSFPLVSSVWPDGGIKSSPILPKDGQKVALTYFIEVVTHCKRALKVTKYLGKFWKKICHLDQLKIAQSGHTGSLASGGKVALQVLCRGLRRVTVDEKDGREWYTGKPLICCCDKSWWSSLVEGNEGSNRPKW